MPKIKNAENFPKNNAIDKNVNKKYKSENYSIS